MKTIGEIIRDSREDLGLQQPELAKKVGNYAPDISAWENDHTKPTKRSLAKLAKHLSKSKYWIIDKQGKIKSQINGAENEEANMSDLRYTIEVQKDLISQLKDEIKRLRGGNGEEEKPKKSKGQRGR